MKYILDSSVAFKWRVQEKDSEKATNIREAFKNQIHELYSPDFFPTELAHALTRAERKTPPSILPGQAELFWLDAFTTPPILLSSLPVTQRAIQIATKARIGVYDCVYVALAEREQCELVTADDKLVRALQPQFPFITLLSSFP